MRLLSFTLLISFLLISFVSPAAKDYLYVVKFDKGEMFSDVSPDINMSLSKEHGKDGKISLKIIYEKDGFLGEWKPVRAFWGDYSKLTFYIYNDSAEEKTLTLRIKGAKEPPKTPENTFEIVLKLPPKESFQEIDLKKAVCLDGKSLLDYSKIYVYSFDNKDGKPLTVYLSEFKLVK